MKAFFQRNYAVFKETGILNEVSSILGWIISLLITCYVLILMAIPLHQTSAPKGIVFAHDNDGGRAIETSMATRWYNSNHFSPYGNLYYRLSHSLADLLAAPADNELSAVERREFTHNFSLKLVSLFSLFAFGLFLGWIFFGIHSLMPLFASLLLVLSTHIDLWSKWVFRPHPEHLLLLTTGMASYFFIKLLAQKENRKLFIVSAMLWGITMAVKRSTAIFLPGCFIFLLLPWRKENIKLVASFIGYMLFSYLLIGFPQNFGFYKHIKFLLYESSLHSRGDLESISYNLVLVYDQLKLVLPLLLLATLFSRRSGRFFTFKSVIFVLLAFIPILMRKMSFLGDHHTMPLAIATLIVLLVTFQHYISFRILKFSTPIFFIAAIVAIKFMGIGNTYSKYQKELLGCRTEMAKIISIISNEIGSEKLIFKEPTFPFNEKMSQFMQTQWGLEWDKVTNQTHFLGIHQASYIDYDITPPKSIYGKMLEDWDKKSMFYRGLRNQERVTSPQGFEFKKVFTGCGFEIWSR